MQLTDFWSSVESADQVRCDVIVSNMRRRTKVTEFQDGLWLIHLLKEKILMNAHETCAIVIILLPEVTWFLRLKV